MGVETENILGHGQKGLIYLKQKNSMRFVSSVDAVSVGGAYLRGGQVMGLQSGWLVSLSWAEIRSPPQVTGNQTQ